MAGCEAVFTGNWNRHGDADRRRIRRRWSRRRTGCHGGRFRRCRWLRIGYHNPFRRGGRRRSLGGTGNIAHGTVVAGQPLPGPGIDHHLGRDPHVIPVATPVHRLFGRPVRRLLRSLLRNFLRRFFGLLLRGLFDRGFGGFLFMHRLRGGGGGAGVGGAVRGWPRAWRLASPPERSSPTDSSCGDDATIATCGIEPGFGGISSFATRSTFGASATWPLGRLPAAPLPPPPCTMYPVAAVAPSMP